MKPNEIHPTFTNTDRLLQACVTDRQAIAKGRPFVVGGNTWRIQWDLHYGSAYLIPLVDGKKAPAHHNRQSARDLAAVLGKMSLRKEAVMNVNLGQLQGSDRPIVLQHVLDGGILRYEASGCAIVARRDAQGNVQDFAAVTESQWPRLRAIWDLICRCLTSRGKGNDEVSKGILRELRADLPHYSREKANLAEHIKYLESSVSSLSADAKKRLEELVVQLRAVHEKGDLSALRRVNLILQSCRKSKAINEATVAHLRGGFAEVVFMELGRAGQKLIGKPYVEVCDQLGKGEMPDAAESMGANPNAGTCKVYRVPGYRDKAYQAEFTAEGVLVSFKVVQAAMRASPPGGRGEHMERNTEVPRPAPRNIVVGARADSPTGPVDLSPGYITASSK